MRILSIFVEAYDNNYANRIKHKAFRTEKGTKFAVYLLMAYRKIEFYMDFKRFIKKQDSELFKLSYN